MEIGLQIFAYYVILKSQVHQKRGNKVVFKIDKTAKIFKNSNALVKNKNNHKCYNFKFKFHGWMEIVSSNGSVAFANIIH